LGSFRDKECTVIEKTIEVENRQIALIHEYRTRLLSDVVTGKMDVRDVVVPEYEALEETADDEESDLPEGEDAGLEATA
jgi:type I restriction enzyme S subunit